MIQILLGGKRGGWTLVDDEDDWAAQWQWSLDGRGYVQRAVPRNATGRKTVNTLHREILGFPKGVVDHINRDPTDNRRSNLRIVTTQMNAQNQSPKRGTSRFRGVYKHTQCDRWAATGTSNGRSVYLGLFQDESAAAAASLAWRLANMPGAID